MSNVYVNSPLLVPPTARNKRIYPGDVTIQNIIKGTAETNVNQLTDLQISDLVNTRQWLHGFEDSTTSVLSFVDATLTFSITGDLFRTWNKGDLIQKDTESIEIENTIGIWYVFYSFDNILTASQTIWDRTIDNPICLINWDGSAGTIIDMRYSCFIINHALLSDQSTLDSISKQIVIPFTSVDVLSIDWNIYVPIFGQTPKFSVWIWTGTVWLPRAEIAPIIHTVGDAIDGDILTIDYDFSPDLLTGKLIISR